MLAAAAVALGVGAAGTVPATAQAAGPLTPLLECVDYDASIDLLTAHFGYYNSAGVPITPLQSENYFDPPPFYRGQPLTFDPGRHRDVFQVSFNAGSQPSLTWNLFGETATASNDPSTYCNPPVGDSTRPLVLATYPTGANVARGDNVTATFSEPMDPATLTPATVLLYAWDSKKKGWRRVLDTAVRCGSPCTTVTLDPYASSPKTLLAGATQHKVTVLASVEDVAHNPMGQDYTWTFSTAKK